ncbi:MAG: TraB/GumN family protein [Planctomycetota bacterium]|jgi:uncharacterized protein YbaP (TraB family)
MSITPFLKRLALGLRSLLPALLLALLPAPLPALQTAQATKQPAATKQVTATKHPFLWRIEGKGEQMFDVKSWLYGTMHLGDERLVTLPNSVEDALESADALYCELEMDRVQKQQQKMINKMLLPRGQTLRDRLPEKLYERLSDYLADRGVDMRTFDRMRVWAVSVNLAAIDAMKEKMRKSLDLMIYKDAKADDKEVGGLETVQEQLSALADTSEEDQIKMLRQSLDYRDKLAAQGISAMRQMLETYLTGDEEKLLAVATEAMGEDKELVKRFVKPMLTDRNIRMADRMAKMMVEHPDKSYFFATGAMHFPGKDGILTLLRKKGYRITRIDPPEKTKKKPRRKLEPVVR